MPKSKPRKRQQSRRPAKPSYGLGGKAGRPASIELLLPSGEKCLVQTTGLEGLIAAGVLNQVDSLTDLVASKYFTPPTSEESGKLDVIGLAQDPEAVGALFDVVNRVVCHTVILPQVQMPPDPHKCVMCGDGEGAHEGDDVAHEFIRAERKDGVLYIDTVDEADQMFIFNAVTGGTQDLAEFRQQLTEALGGLDALAEFADAAQ